MNFSGLQRAWCLFGTLPSLAIDLRAQYKQVLEQREQDSARSKTTLIMDRLRSLPTYAPAGSHACGCGWGVVQIYYLYWLGVCAYVCVCGLCLSNGGLAPV